MRRTLHILALAAVVAALGTLTATGVAKSSGPRLSVVKGSALTLQGTGFKPHARVKVVFTAARQVTKRVTVKSNGRFTVSFSETSADHCTRWTVKATEPGHAAVMTRGPLPMCAPSGGYGGY